MLGLDFGTTNSAVGVVHAGGASRLASFAGPDGSATTFRSVLHFSALDRVPSRRPEPTAGPRAIASYLDEGAGGRFLQSIKSHLASRHLDETYVFGWKFTLERTSTASSSPGAPRSFRACARCSRAASGRSASAAARSSPRSRAASR